MTWQQLNKPPIKEAVFDLKFQSTDLITLEKIKILCDSLKGEFPVINEMFLFEMAANLDKAKEQNVQSKSFNNGYRLANESRSFILQLRLDGFTLSKIEPYVSWDEIYKEAKPLLEKLGGVFPELTFSRAALRYINHFDVTFDEPINSYLNIAPFFPIELPQLIDNFMVRVAIPKREFNLKSIIHVSIDPIGGSEVLYKVIFDIDVFKEATYTVKNLEDLFSDFDRIRDFKNEIFFNGLTSKTLSYFN